MTPGASIKDLYTLALAESEGVGTAYEYYAKRLRLLPWLGKDEVASVLVAGLPEKYGTSLDFLLLSAELEGRLTIVDDRPGALDQLRESLRSLQQAGLLLDMQPDLVMVDDMATMTGLRADFDLALSSEVLQRLAKQQRAAYVGRLLELSNKVALFTPNAHNSAHVGLSGLGGLQLEELRALTAVPDHEIEVGYIDMPPFPPGITRTDDQREEAVSGRFEALAMWGLGYYARAERYLPTAVRRRWSHIVYALISPGPR